MTLRSRRRLSLAEIYERNYTALSDAEKAFVNQSFKGTHHEKRREPPKREGPAVQEQTRLLERKWSDIEEAQVSGL